MGACFFRSWSLGERGTRGLDQCGPASDAIKNDWSMAPGELWVSNGRRGQRVESPEPVARDVDGRVCWQWALRRGLDCPRHGQPWLTQAVISFYCFIISIASKSALCPFVPWVQTAQEIPGSTTDNWRV
jgi:hypothetical protein